MRIFIVIGVMFYAAVIILVGASMMVYALNFLQPQQITDWIMYMSEVPNSRIIVGLFGLLLILISFSFAQLMIGKIQREKTIAFATSSGEVTIALSAVEDLIRRLTGILPEIRELRPDVIATKKGILVDLRVVLRSEANIPELTARLQELTKSRIQEVLGIEEQIVIKIHVAKIAPPDEKERKRRELDKSDAGIPFSGYTRI